MAKSVLTFANLIVMVSIVLALDQRLAFGQRIVIGGGAAESSRNRDRDDDDQDDDKDEDEGRDNDRSGRTSRSRNRTQEQINQFLQRAQRGQSDKSGQSSRGQAGRGGTSDVGNPGRVPAEDMERWSGQFPGSAQMQLFRPGKVGSDVKFGGWQGDRWSGSRDIQTWSRVFAGGKQPFSQDWYREHPKAWKHDNDRANIWINATLPSVYSWLGWGNAPPQQGVTIVNPRSVEARHYGQWYPLGVFSLMSGPGDMGTRIVQLAVDRHGHIKGNYYDIITDANYSVSGDIRRQSQRVYWWLNKNDYIRFKVSLARLMQPYGYITVELPGGEQDWQFVRLEN